MKCIDLIAILAPGLLGGGPVLLVNGEPLVSGGSRETYLVCVEAKTRSSNPLETLPQMLPTQNLPNPSLWSLSFPINSVFRARQRFGGELLIPGNTQHAPQQKESRRALSPTSALWMQPSKQGIVKCEHPNFRVLSFTELRGPPKLLYPARQY